jgi:ABC-type phosphate transport system substrate-binding protein
MTTLAIADGNYILHTPQTLSSDALDAQSNFLQGNVQLVATEQDWPSLSPPQSETVLQLPLSLATVSFFHTIGGWSASNSNVNGPLQLTPDAVAGILTGTITNWTDPLIVKSNNGSRGSTDIRLIVAPGTPITLAGLSPPSQTTLSTLQWLQAASTVATYGNTSFTPFSWSMPVNTTLPWPSNVMTFTAEADLISYLKNNNNSIAFMDSRAGLLNGTLNETALQNQEGNFVTSQMTQWKGMPSLSSFPAPTNYNGWANFTIVNRVGWKSYPIAYIVNLFTAQDLSGAGNVGNVQRQLLGYLYGSKAQNASTSQYMFKLTSNLVNYSVTAVNTIKAPDSVLMWQGTSFATGYVA